MSSRRLNTAAVIGSGAGQMPSARAPIGTTAAITVATIPNRAPCQMRVDSIRSPPLRPGKHGLGRAPGPAAGAALRVVA